MNKYERKISPRLSRNRSKCLNINENGKITNQSDGLSGYHRNYVRFRKSSSRSRSREKSRLFHRNSSIDYRKKLLLFLLQILTLLHFCSLIYCHKRQPSFAVRYALITLILFNYLTYFCVQYDTQQAEHGELLLGENTLLFLIWYGGLIGGGLALLIEKHKHLRSQSFTFRLRLILFFNAIWPCLTYILYMCRSEFFSIDDGSATSLSVLEA